MQTLPPRAPDLLFCTLCVAWALFSQLTPLFGFVFSPLEDFRIFKKNSCGFFYIHSDIHYLCFYKSHSQHRSRQSLGVWESQWWDLLLLHWRILVFFHFWTSYQPDRCPHPLHPGLTLFFLIFLMSSISFFFWFHAWRIFFNSFWISLASIFPVSPLYSQSMDGLGGAWFPEVHLDLLTDARWEGEMGTPVSGVGTNSKFFPQPWVCSSRHSGRKVIARLWLWVVRNCKCLLSSM